MISQKSKIFITGAQGFLGSYIVQALINKGYNNLLCLRRKNLPHSLSGEYYDIPEWIEGDLLDMPFIFECIQGVDIVIHSAADVTFHVDHKKKYIESGLQATANLVNASLENNVKKFIHISSVAAIGRRKKVENIDEKLMFSHSEFDTTYGLMKFMSEQEVWRGHAEGLNVSVLNPSMILGAGSWDRSTSKIFTKIYEGMKYYPSGTNGWVDVRDVAQAVVKCVMLDLKGERFIISAENLSYKTVFDKIASALNVQAPDILLQGIMAQVIWRVELIRSKITGSTPVITKETIRSTSTESCYINTKSVTMLDMNYRSIDETIRDTSHMFLSALTNRENK